MYCQAVQLDARFPKTFTTQGASLYLPAQSSGKVDGSEQTVMLLAAVVDPFCDLTKVLGCPTVADLESNATFHSIMEIIKEDLKPYFTVVEDEESEVDEDFSDENDQAWKGYGLKRRSQETTAAPLRRGNIDMVALEDEVCRFRK